MVRYAPVAPRLKDWSPNMPPITPDVLRDELAKRSPQAGAYATEVVDLLIRAATDLGASDVHLQPTADGLDVRWRLDGVLHPVAVLPAPTAPKVVARLKVLAELLTYKNDVPQEGRVRGAPG